MRVLVTSRLTWSLVAAIAILVVTAPGADAAGCPNEAVRVGPSAHLPDCRAYELVSPPSTNGLPTTAFGSGPGGGFQSHFTAPNSSSENGEGRVDFSTFGGSIPGLFGNGNADRYQSDRTSTGWVTTLSSPTGAQSETSEPAGLSDDLGTSVFTLAPGNGTLNLSQTVRYTRSPSGAFQLIGEGSLASDPEALMRWISPNGAHQIFTSRLRLEADAPAELGSSEESAGFPYTNPKADAVYERSPSGLSTVSLLPGNVTPGPGTTTWYRDASVDGSAVLFNVDNVMYERKGGETLPIASSRSVGPETVLTCSPGETSATVEYQWLRDGTPIAGAEGARYETSAADLGAVVQCEIVGTQGTGVVIGAAAGPLVETTAGEPTVTPPEATGAMPSEALKVGSAGGQVITCESTGWKGTSSLKYQWYRSGVEIVGAESPTYTVTAGDLATPAIFQCRVTGVAGAQHVVQYSRAATTEPAPEEVVLNAEILGVGNAPAYIEPLGMSTDGRYVAYLRLDLPRGFTRRGDIFWVDTTTGETVQVTSKVDAAAINVSADGSHVFFTSPEQLDGTLGTAGAENFYVWSKASGVTFISELSSTDTTPFAQSLTSWMGGVGAANQAEGNTGSVTQDPSKSTTDGHVLVFASTLGLTGYETAGFREIYRYDEDAPAGSRLLCISCGPPGTSATSEAKLAFDEFDGFFFGPKVPLTSSMLVDNVTQDGNSVYFDTGDALVPQDTDGVQDVYEWRDGSVSLISSGQSASDNWLYGVSPGGKDVFFVSRDSLVPEKAGSTFAIYDAREGGGFPTGEGARTECTISDCQPATPPPAVVAPGSEGLDGPGNVNGRCTAAQRQAKTDLEQARKLRKQKGGSSRARATRLAKAKKLERKARAARKRAKNCSKGAH